MNPLAPFVALYANETNYNISEGVLWITIQYAICYSMILPPADERKIRLMEIAARGSPNFYWF